MSGGEVIGVVSFWDGYDATLYRVRDERPGTLAELAEILNAFQPPSSGIAFFGNNANDVLAEALIDAGWEVTFLERDYLWEAGHPKTGEVIHYVEGDLYAGPWSAPSPPGKDTM